jgi:hypothetical protein
MAVETAHVCFTQRKLAPFVTYKKGVYSFSGIVTKSPRTNPTLQEIL